MASGMTQDRLLAGRTFLRLSEAITLGHCTVDDIFSKAAAGKLVVYAIANNWKAGRVFEIDGSIEIAEFPSKVVYQGPDLPPMPDPSDETYAEWQHISESRDQIFGNVIDYARRGQYSILYRGIVNGFQPIARFVFDDYLVRHEEVVITLDLNRMLKIQDQVHLRYVVPQPSVFVKDELAGDRLVVMDDEYRRLLGQDVAIDLSVFMDDPRWPPELGLAISAWQAAVDRCKEGDKPKDVIKEWMKTRQECLSLSSEAKERIATIANWDRSPGRKKTIDGD